MIWRFVSFLFCQLLGGAVGWWLDGGQDAHWITLAGAVCGGIVWFLIDLARGARLLRWLRVGNSSTMTLSSGLWGEVMDRTRRQLRAREQKTRDSDSRLQDFLAALQASPNGVVLLDADARIEWFNQMAANHFGLDAQRDHLQHFAHLVRDPGFATYFNAKNYLDDVVMLGRQSTNSRPVRLSVQLHPYGEGRSLLLSRDITAVEQAEAMRRDFVANVSHEIRTPLTVMSGFVETLQTLPLDEQERERYLGLMAQQSERMQTLVSDLLMLSRLEGSPLPSDGEWLALSSLAQQVEQEARSLVAVLLHSAGRKLELDFEPAPAFELSGAHSEWISAMSNLVGNAIRYTPSGGQVHVGWQWLADGRLEFLVRDTGPGIAPEHIPRLTERFYRVDRSRSRDTGGTGLGLAIVKHVLQRHGSELRIDSTPGVGSTFAITFARNRLREAPASLPTPAAVAALSDA